MSVQKPAIVLLYRQRADSFYRSAFNLDELKEPTNNYLPSIGLLAVHASIALADAVLVSVGVKGGSRPKEQNHNEAAERLRNWCSAKKIADGGITHFEWLLGNKNRFSYEGKFVRDDEFEEAKVKMDQFFAWVWRAFPDVAKVERSVEEMSDA